MRVETTRPARRQRRGTGLRVVLAVVLAVCLVVGGVAAAASVLFGGNGSVAASFIQRQPGALPWSGHSRITALLVGVDKGIHASAPAEQLIVVSFDPGTHRLKLLSIPSNLWVTIPGFGPGTIGTAYADGGIRLTLLTVESVLHVDIPYYVVAGSSTLRDVVNAAGGVTVGIGTPLALRVPGTDGMSTDHINPGMRHLDGDHAVAVLNMPNTGTGDVLRRQQDLLLALERSLLDPANVLRIPTLVNSFGGQFITNFPYDRTPQLAQHLAHTPASAVDEEALTYFNGAISEAYATNSRQVLMGDWQSIRAIAQRMFPDAALQESPVHVLNGTGQTGEAATLSAWLRLSRVRVPAIGTAPSFNYSHTEVVAPPKATRAELDTAHAVGTLLQAPVVTGRVQGKRPAVTVIIGRDFQDPTQQ